MQYNSTQTRKTEVRLEYPTKTLCLFAGARVALSRNNKNLIDVLFVNTQRQMTKVRLVVARCTYVRQRRHF